jgi:hypothetical protein
MNLRAQAEADLAVTLEDGASGFGMPVILIAPDGTIIDKKTGTTDTLMGQILYDSTETTEVGIPTIVTSRS